MAAEHTGWVNLPLHMQGDAMDKILRSNLSEPALRHG
jgi:hypothetical protein